MKNLKIFSCFLVFGVCILISSHASAQYQPRPGDGYWSLYSQNTGLGTEVLRLSSELPGDLNLGGINGANNVTRSVGLTNIPAGRTLTLFDDAAGGTNADYCQIYVKRHTPSVLITLLVPTLENSYEDFYVIVTYIHVNGGLDGHVSHTRVN